MKLKTLVKKLYNLFKLLDFYDDNNQTVGVTSCCYANPTDIEAGHTATFDSFAMKDDVSSTPKSFRLSFDWQ